MSIKVEMPEVDRFEITLTPVRTHILSRADALWLADRIIALGRPTAADYTPPCPDCGVPMAEQRPGSCECLEEGCGAHSA